MAKKRKSERPPEADHGPVERQQHGAYVAVETARAGIKAIRNVTITPIETYRRRKTITNKQYDAAEIFAQQYHKAQMEIRYAQARYDRVGGEPSEEYLERINDLKWKVRNTIEHLGQPLGSIVEHVAGQSMTAGSWHGVKQSKRRHQDGMVALRLALTALAKYYKM
jgi:hypothetical protein|tara:strand:- start:486 stop:983 length:498 start_codon:yes stop_codon:yes gene_type:complete